MLEEVFADVASRDCGVKLCWEKNCGWNWKRRMGEWKEKYGQTNVWAQEKQHLLRGISCVCRPSTNCQHTLLVFPISRLANERRLKQKQYINQSDATKSHINNAKLTEYRLNAALPSKGLSFPIRVFDLGRHLLKKMVKNF